jgi:membrane associated rhomboid family serine protease
MKAQFFPYEDVNLSDRPPYFTYGIILANIVLFAASFIDLEFVLTTYGFTPASPGMLAAFTSMFLHAGVIHLFVNMWYLYIFGDNIEYAFGRAKFLLFYLASGIFALAFHYVTSFGSDIPVVGASGAVSGILGTYLVLLPHMKIKAIGFYMVWKLPTYVIIGSWFVLQLVLAIFSVFASWSNVAFWAHVGGFVFGAMVGFIYNKHLWARLARRYRKQI